MKLKLMCLGGVEIEADAINPSAQSETELAVQTTCVKQNRGFEMTQAVAHNDLIDMRMIQSVLLDGKQIFKSPNDLNRHKKPERVKQARQELIEIIDNIGNGVHKHEQHAEKQHA